MKDIGILASLDPVAVDQACMDLVIRSDDPGRDHFLERVNSRNGLHTLEAAAELGYGSREYELIEFLNGGRGNPPFAKGGAPMPAASEALTRARQGGDHQRLRRIV